MDDIELLSGVMDKTATVVGTVRADQWPLPTPCPDYDVRALVRHMAGWVAVFDAAANGRRYDGDPTAYQLTDDTQVEFRAAADSIVAGWRSLGTDRGVRLTGGELPGAMAVNMTVMEFLTHGWDLATATGQSMPYTEAEAEDALARAQATLPPQYRGDGHPFGDVVAVPDNAPAIARFVGFMGRRPAA